MTVTLLPEDEARVEAFAGRIFEAALGAMELANVDLGVRLGLYAVLAEAPCTAEQLASRAGIAARYAREWLEQQAVAAVVEASDSDPRVFTLPAAHAHTLLEQDSEAYLPPLAAIVPWLGPALDLMAQEFRRGEGLDFGAFALHDIQAAMTRPVFANHLVQTWLPAIPEVQQRLAAGDRVRIAEVGCGEGLAAVILAQAYPQAEVHGFDLDKASLDAARAAAASSGVTDQVHFHQVDAADLVSNDGFDLVLAIEMLHDVQDPVGVLRSMKELARGTGAVVVVDERSKDSFTVDGDPMERMFYAFSTLHCLSVSLQNAGAGTGTVIRESTVRDYASQAGFADVEVLDVEHPQFRLYRLR